MTKDVARTNGDLVQPAVDQVKTLAMGLAGWARDHPDEACLGLVPLIGVVAATRRHHLSFPEALILSELGYWCGVLAVREYRRWKTKPTSSLPGPRLRKVQ